MDMTSSTKTDRAQANPVLRNLQYSPIKEQDEQYIVLWDPSGLSREKLVLPAILDFHLDRGLFSCRDVGECADPLPHFAIRFQYRNRMSVNVPVGAVNGQHSKFVFMGRAGFQRVLPYSGRLFDIVGV